MVIARGILLDDVSLRTKPNPLALRKHVLVTHIRLRANQITVGVFAVMISVYQLPGRVCHLNNQPHSTNSPTNTP